MGDEGDGGRAAAGDGAQEREDAEPVGRREGRGGLVGQEDGRAERHRAGDGHAGRLAARELRGAVAEAVAQPDGAQALLGLRTGAAGGDAVEQEGERRVLERGELGEQARRLEYQADGALAERRQRPRPQGRGVLP